MKIIFKFIMPNRNNYQTKQKQAIQAAIRRRRKSFTITDLKNSLDRQDFAVGETTIYRAVSELVKRGIVVKTLGQNHESRYEYLKPCASHDHFYLKCEHCGDKIHADCACVSHLSEHIGQQHHFVINQDNLLIRGTCSKCQKNHPKEENEKKF